jgi:pullulanase/glycogen debranching enzyme
MKNTGAVTTPSGSFFSVMGSYGPERHSLSASVALKKLVKELHRNGIEVILDVVYSHTAEDGDEAPKTISFRGIDNANYYILDKFGTVLKSDFGTANSFNCNHPIVQKLVKFSLSSVHLLSDFVWYSTFLMKRSLMHGWDFLSFFCMS